MLVIYITGPIFNPSAWHREQNILRAEQMRLDLLDAGFAPICVHSMARTAFGERDEEVFLRADFAFIERSDAIQLIEGWERSRGSAKEIALAHQLYVPVFREKEDLVRWARRVEEDEAALPEQRVPLAATERRRQLRRLAIDYGALVPGSDGP